VGGIYLNIKIPENYTFFNFSIKINIREKKEKGGEKR